MSPRTQEQFAEIRSDRKSAIMDAALQIFSEEGYHGASISKIAKEAGISKGLMYNYFESKENLLHALLNDLFERIVTAMQFDANEKFTDEVMIRHINRTFEVIDEDRRSWRLYFTMVTREEVMEISKEMLLPKAAPFMTEMINYFAEKGNVDPLTTMRYFSATMDGAKMQYLFDPENFPLEKIKEEIINQFVRK